MKNVSERIRINKVYPWDACASFKSQWTTWFEAPEAYGRDYICITPIEAYNSCGQPGPWPGPWPWMRIMEALYR